MPTLFRTLVSSPSIQLYAKKIISENEPYVSSDPDAISQLATEYMVEQYAQIICNKALKSGPKMYKVYTIPKKNGGKRTIAHPAKDLKLVQRALIDILSEKLYVHENAFAYKKNTSIKDNAERHVKNKYLLKMDLEDFFNSINDGVFFSELEKNKIYFEKEDRNLLSKLLFWSPSKSLKGKLILSVGAPSSPLISNFIMYRFDVLVSMVSKQLGITYTRYADDLFFSTNTRDILSLVPDIVKFFLVNNYQDRLKVNLSKTTFSSKAHNRHVTGLTLTNEGRVSLGRERKRKISSLVHKFKIGILDEEKIHHLQGLLGFAKHAEPEFIERLENKYSKEVLKLITSGKWEGA